MSKPCRVEIHPTYSDDGKVTVVSYVEDQPYTFHRAYVGTQVRVWWKPWTWLRKTLPEATREAMDAAEELYTSLELIREATDTSGKLEDDQMPSVA